MLRGELHKRGSAGRCEACGEIFPCLTGLAIYEAVKREDPTPPPPPAPPVTPAAIAQSPVLQSPRWEDLDDRADRWPSCLHWWVSHGSEPDPDGCGMIMSGMAERTAMAEEDRRLLRNGAPPEAAGVRLSLPTRLRLSGASRARSRVGQTNAWLAGRRATPSTTIGGSADHGRSASASG